VSRFARDAAAAGVNGIVIPDLPHEESGPLREAASDAGMALISLVAPTTNEKRLQKILAEARGFVYCVSVTGVTGARENIADDLDALTGKVRRFTSLPLAVGFGIAGPEQAARVAQYCDAVIVGSAVVKIIDSYGDTASALPEVGKFVSEIKAALK
jgi:tryptophan synthase alpha chain